MDLTLGKRLRALSGPVLVTGHTGFKGAWLTLLLERLGVPVVGLSLPAEPFSLYERMNRKGAIPEDFLDIRDFGAVQAFMAKYKPGAIFHMAAQPLVLESYKTPRETFETNVMGTVNILDAAFATKYVEGIVVVTTDKVYRNDNSGAKFVESDALAGKDPYSASKVGTESAVAAWQQISKVSGGPKVMVARAGNVIGGGDWADDRIIPDLIRGFSTNSEVIVRNPKSTRPWQHVLDPLLGYVMFLEAVLNGKEIASMNFGPDSESLSVSEIVEIGRRNWPLPTSVEFAIEGQERGLEAIALQLDSRKARTTLNWSCAWDQNESVTATIQWWDKVLNKSVDPIVACEADIDQVLSNTRGLGIS
ncbi:MAG: CDP-glucose 4,6-dehydratase [Candidatus Nanopelagicaceae bacterium]|nr:CDP-glucose 4,6-dehydratase [Candidatus Nanopelagicaceae bacterium]